MTEYTLTKTRMQEGIWHGVLTADAASADDPIIVVSLLEERIEGVKLTQISDQSWDLRIPIPVTAIADGVHTILIQETLSGTTLDSITILAGETLSEDIRAEMGLLRAELDMLKRAFRRHCVETT